MSHRNVPFFDYPRAYLDEKDELLTLVDKVCSSGAFILQSELEAFETNLARFSESSFAIGVGNATDGLELAWMAMDLKPGDEVICSAHTMLATASSIKIAGGQPVPVDIGLDGLIDPAAVADAIGPNTRGIMPTQLNGRTCDMESIMSLATRHDLIVIEDAAQALGSKFDEKCAGTFGSASAISFYPAKTLGCLGDGGAILVQDPDLYEHLYELHDHGRGRKDGLVKRWGRNSRLDNVQAAILDWRLTRYESYIDRRRTIASIYDERLAHVEQIKLPPPPAYGQHYDVFQNYEVQVVDRDKLRESLKRAGVGTLIQWGGVAIHQMQELGFKNNLPNTDDYFSRCLMLPMNTFISDDDIHYVCDQITLFFGEKL